MKESTNVQLFQPDRKPNIVGIGKKYHSRVVSFDITTVSVKPKVPTELWISKVLLLRIHFEKQMCLVSPSFCQKAKRWH